MPKEQEKPKKPKRAKKYFQIVYEGGAKKQRRLPVEERSFDLELITQIGPRRLRTKIAPLNGEDKDILLHQFLRKQLGTRTFKRDELPGVSLNELMEGLPFARKLRQTYLKNH